MTRKLIWISLINLTRDRIALALTFLLPLLFFTVFAEVFGGLDDRKGGQIDAAIYFEESTDRNGRLEAILNNNPQIHFINVEATDPADGRNQIRERLRSGSEAVGVIIPVGFSEKLGKPSKDIPEIILINNEANPLASPVVQGALQAAALSLVVEALNPFAKSSNEETAFKGLFSIKEESAIAGSDAQPSVAFFAAGLGVMFLLFSMSGRSAILLEERETGVLTRLLCSGLSLNKLLLSRWLFLTLLGCIQVSLMFLWAALVFGLDLWSAQRLLGFTLITAATASAASAFGILLAVSCRSRIQLNAVASVLILVMSAMGGSMFPRFLMSESMQQWGRLTFNAWALDGYQKVFWYGALPGELFKELLVLTLACIALLFLASTIAKLGIEKHLV